MQRAAYRRFRKLLRFPALALLMLAVLVNPVFAALGDLHESRNAASAHLHDVDQHASGLGVEEQDGDGDLLHALMHASHCCGHLTGIVAGVTLLALPRLLANVPTQATAAPHSHIPGNRFRPPITV